METNFNTHDGEMEERLWSFIDGTLPHEEKTGIESLIESHAAWKAKYHELLDVNKLLQASELDGPSMRFTRNVMEEIAKLQIAPATKTYINKKIIWAIGLFFITIITGFLVYGFAQMDWNAGGSSSFTDKLSNVDISKFFANSYINAFMMINVVLGLFLLDNYLGVKRKEYRQIKR